MTTPFIDPQTIANPTTSQALPASWGDNVRNNIVTLANGPGCSVRRSSAQSIPDATLTAVAWNDSDIRDTDAFHDTASNNTRIVFPTGLGGFYLFGFNVAFGSSATGGRLAGWRINGATVRYGASQDGNTSFNALSGTDAFYVSAGWYVELMVFQNSTGALNVDNGTAFCHLLAWS